MPLMAMGMKPKLHSTRWSESAVSRAALVPFSGAGRVLQMTVDSLIAVPRMPFGWREFVQQSDHSRFFSGPHRPCSVPRSTNRRSTPTRTWSPRTLCIQDASRVLRPARPRCHQVRR